MNVIDFPAFWQAVSGQLYVLLVLTAVDFIYGTVLALVQKRFSWEKLTGYITSDVLPIIAWMVVAFIAAIPAKFVPANVAVAVPYVVYATVFLRMFASIMGHVSASGVLTNALEKVAIEPSGK